MKYIYRERPHDRSFKFVRALDDEDDLIKAECEIEDNGGISSIETFEKRPPTIIQHCDSQMHRSSAPDCCLYADGRRVKECTCE